MAGKLKGRRQGLLGTAGGRVDGRRKEAARVAGSGRICKRRRRGRDCRPEQRGAPWADGGLPVEEEVKRRRLGLCRGPGLSRLQQQGRQPRTSYRAAAGVEVADRFGWGRLERRMGAPAESRSGRSRGGGAGGVVPDWRRAGVGIGGSRTSGGALPGVLEAADLEGGEVEGRLLEGGRGGGARLGGRGEGEEGRLVSAR